MNSIIWVETLLVYTVWHTSHLRLTIHSRVMKLHSSVQMKGGGTKVLYDVSCGEAQCTHILQASENDCMWAKNKFGYNINLWTDCFNEIIFLDKWACTKKLAQPKTFFSSKSWRNFSKERLHTTVTCHCAILRNIEILVYYRGTSFQAFKCIDFQRVKLNNIY